MAKRLNFLAKGCLGSLMFSRRDKALPCLLYCNTNKAVVCLYVFIQT